jgi:hypothetical protein
MFFLLSFDFFLLTFELCEKKLDKPLCLSFIPAFQTCDSSPFSSLEFWTTFHILLCSFSNDLSIGTLTSADCYPTLFLDLANQILMDLIDNSLSRDTAERRITCQTSYFVFSPITKVLDAQPEVFARLSREWIFADSSFGFA